MPSLEYTYMKRMKNEILTLLRHLIKTINAENIKAKTINNE